jgi:Leucine-rich repeat (LRR) protein
MPGSSRSRLATRVLRAAVVAGLFVMGHNLLRTKEPPLSATDEPQRPAFPAAVMAPGTSGYAPVPPRVPSAKCDRGRCEVTGAITPDALATLRRAGMSPASRLEWRVLADEIDTARVLGEIVTDLQLRCDGPLHGLAALRDLPALQKLSFTLCDSVDVASLAKLPHLTKLDLGEASVSSLAFLASLSELEELDLHGPFDPRVDLEARLLAGSLLPIDAEYASTKNTPMPRLDLSPLAALGRLRTLRLGWRPVEDLAPLRELHSLEKLDIRGTLVTDLSGLADSGALTELTTERLRARDLRPIGNLANLRTLVLRDAHATDYRPLARLSKLADLDLGLAKITRIDVLAGLPSLKSLSLNATTIEDWPQLRAFACAATLEDLTLGKGLTDLSLLAGLRHLAHLMLPGSYDVTNPAPPFSHPEALANLTELQTLWANETRGLRLAPLIGLRKLRIVHAQDASLDDVAAFAKARPDVKVDQ